MRDLETITAEARAAQAAEDVESMRRLLEELEAYSTPLANARRHFMRGTVARVEAQFPTSLEEYSAALQIYQDMNDQSTCAAVLANIGIVHWYTGSYATAQESFHRALAIREEEGNAQACARVLGNIGLCYMSVKDFTKALEYLQRSYDILESSDDLAAVATAAGNVGSVYANMQEFESALSWYQRSLELNRESGNRHGAEYIQASIANSYLILEKWDEARLILQELKQHPDMAPNTMVLYLISVAYLQRHDGDSEGARANLFRALDHAKRHGLRGEEASCYKELRDVAEQQGSLTDYIAYNNEFMRQTEEIKGQETTRRLALQEKERELEQQARIHDRERAILFSTLPQHVAERVIKGEHVTDHYEHAAVLFLDIAGFTTIADKIPAGHVVHLLDAIFTACDRVCSAHGVTKIKTIGDSYLAVAFSNTQNQKPNTNGPAPDHEHIVNAGACALEMLSALNALEITMPSELGDTSWTKDIGDIQVRIGVHCGPVTAGVIGTERMQYDVWGDTVNVASRMEGSGEPGRIHVSEAFATALQSVDSGLWTVDTHNDSMTSDSMTLFKRGEISIKGKGPMTTYWLEGTE